MSLLRGLKERVGWNTLLEHKVPKHANDLGYCLGGLTVATILVLAGTGVLLEQFYSPSPSEAHSTVEFIMTQVSGGALVRSVHYWAGQFAAVIVGLHMIRVLAAGAYKKPREIQWLVGIGLLFTVGAFLFTGTVLKWDQEGVEGLQHNIEIAEGVGALGHWFLPHFAENVPLLVRLLVAHVSILPVIGLVLLGLHFVLIRVLGISSSVNGAPHPDERVPFTEHVKRVVMYSIPLVIVILVLAVISPAPLGPQAVEEVEVSKPPWFVLWVYGIENLWGLEIVPYVTAAIAIVLMIIPLLDRVKTTDPRRRKLILGLVFLGYVVIFALTAYAALKPPETHLMH